MYDCHALRGILKNKHYQSHQVKSISDMDSLKLTLENTAQILNEYTISWMIIGGAAMVLYDLEKGPVADIDIILTSKDAALLCKHFSWMNYADAQSSRFRSDYLLRPDLGPIPVEILGGFRISTTHGWIDVSGCETQTFHVRSQKVFLPTRRALSSIFRLCGREKDFQRVALLGDI